MTGALQEQQRLSAQGVEMVFEPAEGVFVPSPNGLFYARSVTIHPGERVIDIGTGSGVLAIMAARLGASVEATDTDPRAVAAAERNASLNGVRIGWRPGSLFADARGSFDVILANLPNEIVDPAYLASLDKADARVFAGGESGIDLILALLEQAKRYMHAGSRLYLPIHTLTDYHRALWVAMCDYQLRLVSFSPLPVKPFVDAHLDFYRQLNDSGVIHIFRNEGGWHSYGYIYEAKLMP
jgi:methylase of polypeptide subunit release factors